MVHTTYNVNGTQLTLQIKRDDQINAYISGNKWRKTTLQLDHITRENLQGIITCGGPWSNHLLATAVAAHTRGIASLGVVRGDYYPDINPTLSFAMRMGMQLYFLPNKTYSEFIKNPGPLIAEKNWLDYYFVPPGGDNEAGVLGCQSIVTEVLESDSKPDIWLIPAGYGTTAAGVVSALDYPCEVWIYPAVSEKKEYARLLKKCNQLTSRASIRIMPPHRCSFGKLDQQLVDFIQDFYRQTDILLDPIYNGKMLASFTTSYDDSLSDKHILAYHSGGLFGWTGMVHQYHRRHQFSFIPLKYRMGPN